MRIQTASLVALGDRLHNQRCCPPCVELCTGVYDGDLTISTEADLAQYGDLCEITGDLRIHKTDLTTLNNAFSQLTTIGGYLSIRNNPALGTLGNAFSQLTSIGGYLAIADNGALKALHNAFSNLASVGYLSIRRNYALEALGNAFTKVTSIGGNLEIKDNTVLGTLGNAFTSPDGVEIGGVYEDTAIFISRNAATTTARFDPTQVCYTTAGAIVGWELVDTDGVQYATQPSECP
jgi:hypothetical protein